MSFQSFSVPTSPAMTRSLKIQPVTPQRLPRQQQQHRHSQSLYKSPTTPSTPYSPLSLRSATSAGSSTLTTPDNSGIYSKQPLFNSCSPLVSKTSSLGSGRDRSLADIAENWRSRANENGIKVSSENSYTEGSQFGDDEASERTLSDSANDLNVVATGEALLPPPFLSNQRRSLIRPRAQTHTSMSHVRTPSSPTMTRTSRAPTSSPLSSRRTLSSLNQSENLMATPPPNRILASQLKLKGSFTDPAHTRRREAFGVVRTPSQNVNARNASYTYGLNPNTSLDLFDIDEGDFECDYDSSGYPRQDGGPEESFSLDVDSLSNDMYGYPSYPLKFSQSPFADPFQGATAAYTTTAGAAAYGGNQRRPLGTIAENAEYPFQAAQQDGFHKEIGGDLFIHGPERNYYPFASQLLPQNTYYTEPSFVPFPPVPLSVSHIQQLPLSHQQPVVDTLAPSVKTPPRKETPPTSAVVEPVSQNTTLSECSVCLVKHPRTLAILMPCGHPLCSACLTSALNIVGEKDMECAVCKLGVDDFRLITIDSKSNGPENLGNDSEIDASVKSLSSSTIGRAVPNDDHTGGSFTVPIQGGFEFGSDCDGPGEQGGAFIRASTPKEEQSKATREIEPISSFVRLSSKRVAEGADNDNVVLRIDNVPWDITPPQVKNWLQQPVERVHILLDAKGKTLSHAYVEVMDANVAGAILRGEAHVSSISAKATKTGRKERSSVLGRGRRARGVTVTRSGQEELMADLFPNWRGTFDGSRPSLAGLDGEHIIDALEGGLMTENELKGLLYLIREPDSHFLKVPSLPFHLLMSILSKFPSDVDSRVFWSSGLRDLLYDVTYAAVQILLSRVREHSAGANAAYSIDLIVELVEIAVNCRALTSQQLASIHAFAKQESISLIDIHESIDCLVDHDRSASTTIDSEPLSYCEPVTPSPDVLTQSNERVAKDVPIDELAREFGIEAQLVHALAQRLAGLNT
ncbi:hypothetical protein AX17_004897 [Amanita inopinata Kibby_2008]|nr:hypothetical protein AX17_004897 [Amanita inopinata Kibby_2008]